MNVLYWGIEFFASFLQTLMCFFFCGTFLFKDGFSEYRYKMIGMALLEAFVVIALNFVSLFSQVNTFIILLVLWLFQWLIFKMRIMFSFLLTVIYYGILAAIDGTTTSIVSLVGGVDISKLIYEHNILRVFNIFLSLALLSVLMVSINRFTKKSRILPKSHVAILFLGSSFLFISIYIMIEINLLNQGNIGVFSTVFFFSAFAIVLFLFFFILKLASNYEQLQKMSLIEMKSEMLQKSLDDTEQTFNLWRKSVHDYKNNILALSKLAEENNIDEIKKFLEKETQLVNSKMFYIRTGSAIVDTIVNTKQNIASQKNIVFVVNAFITENCKIKDTDLSVVLGNLIDNAIEASEKENNPDILVTIKQNKEFLIIDISNKYTGEFSQSTTKSDKEFHGIGLESVKSIVNECNGEFKMYKEDDRVYANVILQN